MKERIIELMELAGYDFIKENTPGQLYFHDLDAEQDVQFWYSGDDAAEISELRRAMKLIVARAYDKGFYSGKASVRNSIKDALKL
jgi:hypothetical protein